jgi:hypothetical protein
MRWWMTRRAERQATRMHDMMDRLNVDAAALPVPTKESSMRKRAPAA